MPKANLSVVNKLKNLEPTLEMAVAWLRMRTVKGTSRMHVADPVRDMVWEASQHGFELSRQKVRKLMFDAAAALGYEIEGEGFSADFLPIEKGHV